MILACLTYFFKAVISVITGLDKEMSPMRHQAIAYTVVKLVEIGYNRSVA